MPVRILSSGSTRRTEAFLAGLARGDQYRDLSRIAQKGVSALAAATPRDSGLTASSWSYDIRSSRGRTTIVWTNSNVHNGAQIAILLQYGHGTGTGGYVAGYDYINPSIRPVFDEIADNVWEKVIHA